MEEKVKLKGSVVAKLSLLSFFKMQGRELPEIFFANKTLQMLKGLLSLGMLESLKKVNGEFYKLTDLGKEAAEISIVFFYYAFNKGGKIELSNEDLERIIEFPFTWEELEKFSPDFADELEDLILALDDEFIEQLEQSITEIKHGRVFSFEDVIGKIRK